MSIDLPKIGQTNWGVPLNLSLTQINAKLDGIDAIPGQVAEATAAAVAAEAAAARAEAAEGTFTAPANDVVAGMVTTDGPTKSALSATFGGAQVDLSGGDATLTSTPRLAHLVGATAARTVTFPAGAAACLVDNDTDYPVTLTRVGGGVVVLSAGSSIEIVGA